MATNTGKIHGWDWVISELIRCRLEARSEAVRLLGPERGE